MKKITVLLIVAAFTANAQLPEPKNVLFLLYNGVEIMDFTGPMEVLSQSGYNVYTVADRDTVLSNGILKVIPDYNFLKDKSYPDPDIVAVFGGMAHMEYENEVFQDFLEDVTENTSLNFSVCDGAFFLGSVGLLDNKYSTTYHWLISELQNDFPKTQVLEDVKYVDNGRLITSAGVSAGIDASFYMVSKLKGNDFAKLIASRIEYDHWKPGTGKIIETEEIKRIKEEGFIQFRKENKSVPLFKGEISNLGEFFLSINSYEEAEACFRFIIENYDENEMDYSNLSNALKKQNKQAPPTKEEFLHLVQVLGAKKVVKTYEDYAEKFPKWQILSSSDLIYLAYYEYQNKGRFEEALDMYSLNYLMFPQHHFSVSYQAECYYLMNDYKSALKFFRKAETLIEHEGTLEFIRGRISDIESKPD